MRHENSCRRKKEAKEQTEEKRRLAQEEFLNSIRLPEEFHVRTMEWMLKWNNLKLEIISERLQYIKISNTHNCPINGVRNWGGRDDLPKGYSGWTDHWIIGISKKDLNSTTFFSSFFDSHWPPEGKFYLRGVNVGAGGSWTRPPHGKSEEYIHYYMFFFIDDFPNLRGKWRTQQLLLGKIEA